MTPKPTARFHAHVDRSTSATRKQVADRLLSRKPTRREIEKFVKTQIQDSTLNSFDVTKFYLSRILNFIREGRG